VIDGHHRYPTSGDAWVMNEAGILTCSVCLMPSR